MGSENRLTKRADPTSVQAFETAIRDAPEVQGALYAEHFLSPSEQALLMEAWPTAPTRCQVRRAARALLTWTVHVWHEAETVLGQPLGVTVSDAELLAVVEQMYR